MMKFFKAAFLLLLADYASGVLRTLPDCGKRLAPKGRIVGGKTATHGDYPWMVSIHQNVKGTWKHVCGGSVINENWILTAAHCFDLPIVKKDYKVYVGLHSILKLNDPTVQMRQLAQIIQHKDYKDNGYANDVALLQTATPIDIKGSKGYINSICLPKGVTTPSGSATVIGWGKLSDGGPMPDKLQYVTIPIVAWKTCKDIYDGKNSEFNHVQVTPATLCAGGQGQDSCQYDSGGPLFQTENGVATLIGTVAMGGDCAYKHYPGLYMKTSAFTTWMGKNMT